MVLAQIAGRDGHTGGDHPRLGRVLQPMARMLSGLGPTRPAGGNHAFGELGIFRQEAIAGVDRLGPAVARGAEDARGVQIAFARRGRADQNGLVGHADVQRLRIGLGIDRDGAQAHLARGTDDAAGDLAAISDEEESNIGFQPHPPQAMLGRGTIRRMVEGRWEPDKAGPDGACAGVCGRMTLPE